MHIPAGLSDIQEVPQHAEHLCVSVDMACLVTYLEVLGHAAVSGNLERHPASNLQVWHALVSAFVMTVSQPCNVLP